MSAGAGRNLEEATAPAVLPSSAGGRVLVFAPHPDDEVAGVESELDQWKL